MKTFCKSLAFVLLTIGLAGCVASHSRTSGGPAIQLTTRKISPTDIELKWTDKSTPPPIGHIVEWATEASGDYVILAFTYSNVNSFVHADLAPATTSFYRVRPYSGPASRPIEITTGKPRSDGSAGSPDETWLQPQRTFAGSAGSKFTIRTSRGGSEAAPTDLKASLVNSTGIHFTWIDHASDEEGEMLEVKTAADPDFHVCAITDPDITSYGYAILDPQTTAQFRVRPFYYGPPSNIAHETTGSSAAQARPAPTP